MKLNQHSKQGGQSQQLFLLLWGIIGWMIAIFGGCL